MNISQRIIINLVLMYRHFLKPFFKQNCCKYYPSCSEYMIQAVKIHGSIKGFKMGINRILRCNSKSKGGEDPVPPPPFYKKINRK